MQDLRVKFALSNERKNCNNDVQKNLELVVQTNWKLMTQYQKSI